MNNQNATKRKSLKFCFDSLKSCLLPLSEKQKKAYMERVEDKVRFYQPRIEQKTGISLGKVYTLPAMLWTYQSIYEDYLDFFDAVDESKNRFRFEKNFIKGLLPFIAIPITAATSLHYLMKGKLEENLCDMLAVEDCVLVPFGLATKVSLLSEKYGGDSDLDLSVVHELSHILWNKIETKWLCPDFAQSIYQVWGEGFATYCHEEFFRDLYPKSYFVDKEFTPEFYKTGKRKIEDLVSKYGEEILLEIPKKWFDFAYVHKLRPPHL